MKVEFSPHFLRSYRKAPALVQRAFDKQSVLLLEDPRHPSLRLKSGNVWQARVNDSWRFYFTIAGDTYLLHEIQAHPKK